MAELTKQQLQALQFNTEVATAADVSSFVNASTTELSSSLIARIQALEGFSTFIGVKDALPESAENGQIVIVGEKEYIWGPKADGVAGWTELGDTTAELAAIDELSSAVAALETTKADVSSVNASVEALTKAIDDVEASLSGYDTVGSALEAEFNANQYTEEKLHSLSSTFGDIVTHNVSEFDLSGSAAAAQAEAISAAKAYTDEQIAAVEGEISSLTDVVETKADQTAVDAAISTINENISTLSAKAEEDPVFTAWKDGESIALGSGATVKPLIGDAPYNTIAIGYAAYADKGHGAIAIGSNALVDSTNAVAIGANASAMAGNSVQLGVGTNNVENSLQFCSTQIVNGDGKITTANLAGIDALKTTVSAIEEVTAEDNVQVLREAVNTLVAAIKTFVGA